MVRLFLLGSNRILFPYVVILLKTKKQEVRNNFLLNLSCGGRTRTCDLQVMSLASYQLLHAAILSTHYVLILNCECKGTAFFLINQMFCR